MTTGAPEQISDFLTHVFAGDETAMLAKVESLTGSDAAYVPLLRTAIFHGAKSSMYYRRLLNHWQRAGYPALKPRHRDITIEILADATATGIEPYLKLFCAAYGLQAKIVFGEFDSVEQEALSGAARDDVTITLVMLSQNWLQRNLGSMLPARTRVVDTQTLLKTIIDGLSQRRSGHVVFSNFARGAFVQPASVAGTKDHMGWSNVLDSFNVFLSSHAHVLDASLALHMAGGINGAGRIGFLRARAPFEDAAWIALAREAASGFAQLLGMGHRAMLTDWDNTLWEGEVGEVGVHGIICGQDSADAFGYYLLQTYLKGLTEQGMLLGAVSRNDPAIARVLEENHELVLRRPQFAGLALSWGNKTDSVATLQAQFKFGTEFMVYIDDNPVDLGQVLSAFPYIDVVPAGPSADLTLMRLTTARFFNALSLTGDDLARSAQFGALAQQESLMAASGDPVEFLKSLNIKLHVSGINPENRERVLQLLQKTNQFNVTTRRHLDADIAGLQDKGGSFGVFRYTDNFGSQGIIGLVILVPEGSDMVIDTWLMSCRVLNRTVEAAMCAWMRQKAGGRRIRGQYIPTEKNALVKDLYPRMGFAPIDPPEAFQYIADETSPGFKAPEHHVELTDE